MEDRQKQVTCSNDTQTFSIELPCRLAERVERYANENGNTIANVVIEALDAFLGAR